jgi:hypothetical protein
MVYKQSISKHGLIMFTPQTMIGKSHQSSLYNIFTKNTSNPMQTHNNIIILHEHKKHTQTL